MKIKLPALILSLATCGLVGIAQENSPPTPEAPPPGTPPSEVQDTPKPAETTPQQGDQQPTQSPTPTQTQPGQTQPTPAQPGQTQPGQQTDPSATPNPSEPAGAGQAGAGAAANPNEPVPLIVIDEVPLTDAIRNLARQSNLNFQFDPRLTGVGPDGKPTNQPLVSIRFENVTAQEALQAVLENYNLQLQRDPRSKIARITIKDPKAEDPLVTKIIQLRYSDPTNMVTLLKPSLSPRSTVLADGRTSQLIVTTTEREVDAVVQTVNRLDTATKQVLIEAHLLETARNPSTIKGIDWAGTLEAQQFTFGNNAVGGTPAFPGGVIDPDGPGGPATPTFIPPTPAVPGGILSNPKLLVDTARGLNPATAFLNADGVSAVLSFLNKDSDTEVVATPRAVTLDNQPAILSITRAFPIFLITPGSANTPAGSQINYTNLGTILHVTPRIAADNNISLRVVPEVSNIDSIDRKVIQNTVNEANIYAIRRVETHVMIPSGNTLVMGGLINDTKTKAYTKVPILGDLPGIGIAFRKESKVRNKSNLLIFITPTIVDDSAYHVTSRGTDFLKTRLADKPEAPESAWDSGRPHDWTKPVY